MNDIYMSVRFTLICMFEVMFGTIVLTRQFLRDLQGQDSDIEAAASHMSFEQICKQNQRANPESCGKSGLRYVSCFPCSSFVGGNHVAESLVGHMVAHFLLGDQMG